MCSNHLCIQAQSTWRKLTIWAFGVELLDWIVEANAYRGKAHLTLQSRNQPAVETARPLDTHHGADRTKHSTIFHRTMACVRRTFGLPLNLYRTKGGWRNFTESQGRGRGIFRLKGSIVILGQQRQSSRPGPAYVASVKRVKRNRAVVSIGVTVNHPTWKEGLVSFCCCTLTWVESSHGSVVSRLNRWLSCHSSKVIIKTSYQISHNKDSPEV